jgi:hypothetical protein
MSFTREQQVLEAMRVAIDGAAKGPVERPSGLTVDRSRMAEVRPTTTHVSIYPMNANTTSKGYQAESACVAKVVIWGKGLPGHPIDEALDPTWRWVHQQLFTDPSLGGLTVSLSNPERIYGFAQHLGPFGDLDLHILAVYRHSAADPAAL